MPSRPHPRDLRASDADRDRVVAVLSAAHADGRLTLEEHDQRVREALQATTLGDLEWLTADLAGPDSQPFQLEGGRPISALFRKESRAGRWFVPAELYVNALGADLTLDFREAVLTDPHTVIHAHAAAGTLRLFVPDGVTVTVDGRLVLGRQKGAAPRGTPPALGMPHIEVRVLGFLSEVIVKYPPKPRRWLGSRRRELQ